MYRLKPLTTARAWRRLAHFWRAARLWPMSDQDDLRNAADELALLRPVWLRRSVALITLCLQSLREELERLLRLGLLLAGEIDAPFGQERSRLSGDLERL
jgi:hypothetical protein